MPLSDEREKAMITQPIINITFIFARQSSLRIPSARGEHAGAYSCVANSSLGDSAEVTAMLVVSGLVPRYAQSPVNLTAITVFKL